MALQPSYGGLSVNLRQRDRLKLNCGLLPDFEVPRRTPARSDLDRAFSSETP
jgi:hypothetical protein